MRGKFCAEREDKRKPMNDPNWPRANAWFAGEHAETTCGKIAVIGVPVRLGSITPGRCDLAPEAIRNIVVTYALQLSLSRVVPHDLRRTFAKLAHKGGSGLDQIQLSLGHESIQTTERYLGIEQDLTDTPCDHLGLRR